MMRLMPFFDKIKLTMASPDATARSVAKSGVAVSGSFGAVLHNFLWGQAFPPIQNVAVFICILGMIFGAIHLAISGITNNPRGRNMAIGGLVVGIVASIIIFNAQTIVAALASMQF